VVIRNQYLHDSAPIERVAIRGLPVLRAEFDGCSLIWLARFIPKTQRGLALSAELLHNNHRDPVDNLA